MDTLFNILHVVAAVFLIGPVAIMPMIALRTLRAGDTVTTTAAAKSIKLLSYLSLIVIVTGFGVLGMADPKYNLSITTPWILGSLVLYLVALVLNLTLVVPAFERTNRANPRATYLRAAVGSGIATLSFLAVIVLMVWKP